LIAIQLCVLASGMILVLSGLRSGAHSEGHISAAFFVLAGLGQLSAGLGLAAKMYLGRATLSLDELRTLKR
jgi:NADH:ubiquinone oxidoreductase subunit K